MSSLLPDMLCFLLFFFCLSHFQSPEISRCVHPFPVLYFVILFNTAWSGCFLWLKLGPGSESIMDHIRVFFAGDLLSCEQWHWTRLPMGGVGE